MALFKSAFIVGGGTLLSRIVGYIRDICIAYFLGVGPVADAFFVATRLPNCFRSLFAEGAFNSAFVPMFAGKLASDGKEKAIIFASHIFSFMFMVLAIFSILIIIFMPYVTYFLAPGFRGDSNLMGITIELSRITFPYLLLVSLVALQSGILNSLGSFGPPAVTSALLNICMIIALFTLTDLTGSAAHALAWGMTLSGIIQFIWLFFSNWRLGTILKFSKFELDSEVKALLKKMVPGIIGSSATQLNIVINTMLATLIPGAVSYLYYADRLVQFPMAIIGTAMATAMLPLLTKQLKQNDTDGAIKSQNKALVFSMLFTLPSACALATIAEPLIEIMFRRGEFSSNDVAATSATLAAYSFGLPAFVLIKIFAPGFFAKGDTSTPVKIAIISIIANIIISLSFIKWLGYIGLALGTSFGSIVNCSLLYYLLNKRGILKVEKKVIFQCIRILACSLIMSGLLYIQQKLLDSLLLGHGLMLGASYIIILIFSGMLFFFISLRIAGGYRFKEVINAININKGA